MLSDPSREFSGVRMVGQSSLIVESVAVVIWPFQFQGQGMCSHWKCWAVLYIYWGLVTWFSGGCWVLMVGLSGLLVLGPGSCETENTTEERQGSKSLSPPCGAG